MFITYPTNTDYLIKDIRLYLGDTGEKQRFSDSLIRTGITNAIKMLQRRWGNRYLVVDPSTYVTTLPDDVVHEHQLEEVDPEQYIRLVIPSGYSYARIPGGHGVIPSGLGQNDIFRNPDSLFDLDDTSVIAQEDEHPLFLAVRIIFTRGMMTSSAESFQVWSDGEYSFSNVASSRAMSSVLDADEAALDAIFKARLSNARKTAFRANSLSFDL